MAYLILEPLTYGLSYEGEISFIEKGKVVGYLDVKLTPEITNRKETRTRSRTNSRLREKIHELDVSGFEDEEIQDPRQLL